MTGRRHRENADRRSRASILDWISEDPDPSLAWQTARDLIGLSGSLLEPLRRRLAASCEEAVPAPVSPSAPDGSADPGVDAASAPSGRGWIAELLAHRRPGGGWSADPYVPKWTCTHYVLYELAQLETPSDLAACRDALGILVSSPRGSDGGINYARTVRYSDVCVNGTLLALACRFRGDPGILHELVEYLLSLRMPDGGWNCAYRDGARHSSLHTTISVLEGLFAIRDRDPGFRSGETEEAIGAAVEFVLRHRLCESERTGELVADEFFRFPFPVRWKYDILRCLDLFRKYDVPADPRMDRALDMLERKRSADGTWKACSQPGAVWFRMEADGKPGRWNTLRALRVLDRYRPA